MTSATIVGLATPEGAYLARLLRARGYRVAGTATDAGRAQAMLAVLGADEVQLVTDPFAEATAEVYLLDGSVALVDALAVSAGARVLVAASAGAALADLAAARAGGRHVVAAMLHGHVSRLDPPDDPVLAACLAVRVGRPAAAADARDLGWTPEYVDGLWRMLQADEPRDAVLSSGSALDGHDIAACAAAYFKVDAVLPAAGAAAAVVTGPPPPGWRAFTYGRELVNAICEGLPPA